MDNNNNSGTNLAFWVPGSAVILSLVISTFALTRDPFLEPRPIGAQFQAHLPIEARLWQDPFDALERYRKKLSDSKSDQAESLCSTSISPFTENTLAPDIMVALVEGGPYADEVERRRRIRYALLAGFKNSRQVPDQEQYIQCLKLAGDLSDKDSSPKNFIDIPYEMFVPNPFVPPTDTEGNVLPSRRTIVFWLKQDALGEIPLQKLNELHQTLIFKLYQACTSVPCKNRADNDVLKVIGPATSTVLRDMFKDQDLGKATVDLEIYSPLATADNEMLDRGYAKAKSPVPNKQQMKLLRTVSDDGTMTQLMLEELKLRHVDPATALRCNKGSLQRVGSTCEETSWKHADRIALISEWDSFYSRALIESFKAQVADDASLRDDKEKAVVNKWILRFSYLRGLDGRLPEETASNDKPTTTDTSKNNKDATKIDLSPLEKADGNSQLDYLRRLADHIANEDETYRRNGESGIGAIGILGVDAYDKLLALQALKSRMPYKLYFSTDLDARMLQRGQAETTRNLILAAPYGLTLTRALQQDVPPFRDSLQSSVFVSVLAALAPQSFDAKRAKFDYSKSDLLSPGIYEVGISGFIPLGTQLTALRPASCEAPTLLSRSDRGVRPHDLMALRCLQDPSPPPYPEPSPTTRGQFRQFQSFFWAGPLAITLLVFAALISWRGVRGTEESKPPYANWVQGIPMSLYLVAVLCAFLAIRSWHVEFLWCAFGLILLGIITSNLMRSSHVPMSLRAHMAANVNSGMYNSSAWYIMIPLVVFVLALMLAYQMRSTLTDNGLGEPMFLFEGISAWPTAALRLLAALISIAALAWGWRNLRVNRNEIENAYHLRLHMRKCETTLHGQIRSLIQQGKTWNLRRWCNELGHSLHLILFPLTTASDEWTTNYKSAQPSCGDGRKMISIARFWSEHCVCGSFGARMLRATLVTWVFLVVTSALFVVWPMERIPVRGDSIIWMLSWLVPTLLFQLLVFWVVDANLLLTRFIRHLSDHYAVWPGTLQLEHKKNFGVLKHPCIDDWMDLQLIAKRTSAVSRLIYAPTVVMLILLASRSSLFDNWPTPPSIVISFLLTALILLASALSLRRAAEQARTVALKRIDAYLLDSPKAIDLEHYEKFQMIRDRMATLNTGSFSRYSEDPLVRALLLSLTGIGGSALVDALNYAKF
ncbi:hypothetical protein [Pseudomonas sp. URMO17WK12:I11]|uniref:hypothetical protein n=1 Tax=Pseudomonas sp. URMO17WK12:I11 TaxID=1283291 RepID=UPI0007212EA7|nr:hypothetical protein [Pseudomonas sp. URMO17WK12:I11]CRL47337.1 hypothetical protein PSHI_03600 [Pseudomonas sp. URMO17WK12:I11]